MIQNFKNAIQLIRFNFSTLIVFELLIKRSLTLFYFPFSFSLYVIL